MQWIKYTELAPPPQGQKVLCFKKGDCWVAYSFNLDKKRIWIPCVPNTMFVNNLKPTTCETPEYWCYIPFEELPTVESYCGKQLVQPEGEDMMDIDAFELKYPLEHKEFVSLMAGIRTQQIERPRNKKK